MEIVKKKSIVGGPLCAKEGHDLCGGMKHGDNNRPAKVGAGPSGVVHLCPSVVAFVFSFFDGNRAIPIKVYGGRACRVKVHIFSACS